MLIPKPRTLVAVYMKELKGAGFNFIKNITKLRSKCVFEYLQ